MSCVLSVPLFKVKKVFWLPFKKVKGQIDQLQNDSLAKSYQRTFVSEFFLGGEEGWRREGAVWGNPGHISMRLTSLLCGLGATEDNFI